MKRWIERCSALAATVLIPLLLVVLPLTTVLAICDHWPRVGAGRATPNGLADRVRRWLAVGRGPWTSTCLTRALVLYAMLRQHGFQPRLHVGVAGEARAFAAHAWVSLDGKAVEQPYTVAERYTPLLVHGD